MEAMEARECIYVRFWRFIFEKEKFEQFDRQLSNDLHWINYIVPCSKSC